MNLPQHEAEFDRLKTRIAFMAKTHCDVERNRQGWLILWAPRGYIWNDGGLGCLVGVGDNEEMYAELVGRIKKGLSHAPSQDASRIMFDRKMKNYNPPDGSPYRISRL